MVKRRDIKRIVVRFSDFILGFLLACLVITLGRHAMAGSIDTDVNARIKEEYMRMDVQQKRAAIDIRDPAPISDVPREEWQLNRGGEASDPQLAHSENISSPEQGLSWDRPRAGVAKKFDPLDAIEQNIIDDQAYQLYRQHYRGAFKKELIGRAQAHGLNPSESLAEEVTSKTFDGR